MDTFERVLPSNVQDVVHNSILVRKIDIAGLTLTDSDCSTYLLDALLHRLNEGV